MASGRVDDRIADEKGVDGVGGAGLTQLLTQFRRTHGPGYGGQRPEVLCTLTGRGEKGEQKIDRTIIDGAIGDRRVQTHEDRADARQTLDAGMGNRHARSKTGRAERLAFQQGVQNRSDVLSHGPGRDLGDEVQRLALGRRAAAQDDAVLCEQITDIHQDPDFTLVSIAKAVPTKARAI